MGPIACLYTNNVLFLGSTALLNMEYVCCQLHFAGHCLSSRRSGVAETSLGGRRDEEREEEREIKGEMSCNDQRCYRMKYNTQHCAYSKQYINATRKDPGKISTNNSTHIHTCTLSSRELHKTQENKQTHTKKNPIPYYSFQEKMSMAQL